MSGLMKNLFFVFLILFLISFIFSLLPTKKVKEISISQLVQDINQEKVKKISVLGDQIEITYKNGEIAKTRKESGATLFESLINYGVEKEKLKELGIEIKEVSRTWDWLGPLLIFGILPILSLFVFLWFLSRQAKVGASQAFNFTKAKARIFGTGTQPKEKITFKDVGGLKEAKEELKEIVDFLKNPKKYLQIGAKIPRGVLLIGAPGTGKTLLARAVAFEAGVPFFSISGSEFVELFVGVGASRVRNLFDQAKKAGRAIIFIDEIDSIGRVRGPAVTGAHEEREQTLNQILAEMDGFEREDGRIVIAASIAGDTPVLIREKGICKLLPISDVIDPYYKEGEEKVEKFVEDLEVLGFERKIPKQNQKNIYFKNSAFKKVRSVYRHRVDEIYEVEYTGGKIKTTGNHSLFIRTSKGLKLKPVAQLKRGDILVSLPFKVNRTNKKKEIRAHEFNSKFHLELPIWKPTFEKFEPIRFVYQYTLSNRGKIPQVKISEITGFAQTTISQWQRGICGPRYLSKNYYRHKEILPERVKVTPELMRLFGYYVAEGYARKEIDFCLNRNEKEKTEDIKYLMKKIFNLEPDDIRFITPGAVNIVYYSKPLANFFAFHCGKGAKNKYLPHFLFEAPFEYFKEFLKGYLGGDGYINKKRKNGELTSTSKQLILQLNWLFRMHGFKSYITSFIVKEGRRIKNGKPLPKTIAWRLGFGKTQNPLNASDERMKGCVWRPIVKNIRKISYNGFVYDFCGCENEAFFAGESPILAHNTNRPDMLDPALLRPGRFDRRIVLDLPDINEREEILKIHCRKKPLSLNVNLREIAERTPGFSGADLENVVNEAALLTAKRNKNQISQEEFLESIDKVLLGPERKSHILSKKEKEIAAFHEAGHALTAASLPEAEPVRKISIVARGLAAGYTLKMPTEERKIKSKKEFLAEIMTLLGGYCAEKIKFGEISTGAANDLKAASNLIRKLVKEYGMSSLGPVTFGEKEKYVFLGREFGEYKNYSEKMAEKIDREILKITKQAEKKVTRILKKKKKILEKIAKRLIEKETIEREEFEKLIRKKSKRV